MAKILTLLCLSLLSGAVLAGGAMSWPIRPGLVGLLALLLSAWLARRYWQRLPSGRSPGSPERVIWHGLVSYALVAGHLATALWRTGPEFAMHSLAAHSLAIDSWTLILGAALSYWIARDPEPRQDERDALILQHARRAAHLVLVFLLLVACLALAFGGGTVVARFNQPMLAELILLCLLLEGLVQHVERLRHYARDARHEQRNA